jgi:hypothetical protein
MATQPPMPLIHTLWRRIRGLSASHWAVIQLVLIIGAGYLIKNPLAPGIASLGIALVGGVMAVRADEKWGRFEKWAWVMLCVFGAVSEFRAIQIDHVNSEEQHSRESYEVTRNFLAVIQSENKVIASEAGLLAEMHNVWNEIEKTSFSATQRRRWQMLDEIRTLRQLRMNSEEKHFKQLLIIQDERRNITEHARTQGHSPPEQVLANLDKAEKKEMERYNDDFTHSIRPLLVKLFKEVPPELGWKPISNEELLNFYRINDPHNNTLDVLNQWEKTLKGMTPERPQ